VLATLIGAVARFGVGACIANMMQFSGFNSLGKTDMLTVSFVHKGSPLPRSFWDERLR